jgi:hypothetical protein
VVSIDTPITEIVKNVMFLVKTVQDQELILVSLVQLLTDQLQFVEDVMPKEPVLQLRTHKPEVVDNLPVTKN